jgi:Arc/MetJ-type ribon-helix-helix transcriptional regulator
MVIGMATTKVTITLDDEQIDEVRRLVAAGRAPSVSGFVQHAVRTALHDAAGWQEMLHDALERTGGPVTPEERAWADALLRPQTAARAGARPRRRTA